MRLHSGDIPTKKSGRIGEENVDNYLYQLTLRHNICGGNNTMKQDNTTYEMSELGKEIGNECLDCPFNMSFKTEIVD